MDIVRLSEWLQAIAAVGVLLGLLLVAYELRQEHDLARAQLTSDTLDARVEINRYFLDPTARRAYVKAHEAPGTLTLEEQLVLNRFFAEVIGVYVGRSSYFVSQGIFELVDFDRVADGAARIVLSSQYGREWWARRRDSFRPFTRDLVDAAGERQSGTSFFEDAAEMRDAAQLNMERSQ